MSSSPNAPSPPSGDRPPGPPGNILSPPPVAPRPPVASPSPPSVIAPAPPGSVVFSPPPPVNMIPPPYTWPPPAIIVSPAPAKPSPQDPTPPGIYPPPPSQVLATAPPPLSATHLTTNGNSPPGSGSWAGSAGFIVEMTVGGVFVTLIVLLMLVWCFRRRRRDESADYMDPNYLRTKDNGCESRMVRGCFRKELCPWYGFSNSHYANLFPSPVGFTLMHYRHEELTAATDGFSDSNLLGEGGFGFVHKGILPTGKQVAVKQLKTGSRQGDKEFQAEVETISRVHHKHLVSLVGFCISGKKRFLVYEFLPNNTLEFHLHGNGQLAMVWASRMKIAVGSAKGLAYLHEDCNPTIIHRDIKASNILLDFNFAPKVSDFGLAKFFSDCNSPITHITTGVVGTFGYLAPEYARSGKVSEKSDVFSYGVMLLELITGRPPIFTTDTESSTDLSLVEYARPSLTQALEEGNFDNLVDPRLQGNYNANEMAKMVACASACVQQMPFRRPRMSQIVRALEGDGLLKDRMNLRAQYSEHLKS